MKKKLLKTCSLTSKHIQTYNVAKLVIPTSSKPEVVFITAGPPLSPFEEKNKISSVFVEFFVQCTDTASYLSRLFHEKTNCTVYKRGKHKAVYAYCTFEDKEKLKFE